MQNFSTSSKYNRGKLVGETFWHFHFKLEENQLAPIRKNKALRFKLNFVSLFYRVELMNDNLKTVQKY